MICWDDTFGNLEEMFESSLDRVQGALLGSQSPHIFWIGGDRLLGVAGGYSPDVVVVRRCTPCTSDGGY